MSTSTTFKQECPSCEALVPIRDPKLIGKKIECPKCKFKFVVKAPPDMEPDDEEKEDDAKSAKKGKKGDSNGKVTDKPKPGKGIKKGKDDDDSKKKEGKKGGQKKLSPVMVGSLAVGAVLALGIGAYVMFSGPSTPKQLKPGQAQPGPGPGQTTGTGGTTTTPTDPTKTTTPSSAKISNPTNLLPSDTVGVCSINVERIQSSPLWKAALSDGPFREETFLSVFGFPLYKGDKGVSRIIIATNPTAKWVFSVVRTRHDIDRDDLVKRLKLGREVKAGEFAYQPVGRQFDSLGNMLFKGAKPCDNFAVHFVDARTFIFADEEPMKAFLEARPKSVDEKKDEDSYTSISSELRTILSRLEGDKDRPLLSLAGDVNCLVNLIADNRDTLVKQGKAIFPQLPEGTPGAVDIVALMPELDTKLRDNVTRVGLGLARLQTDHLNFTLALELKTSQAADDWNMKIDTALKSLTSERPPTMGRPMGGMGENRSTEPPFKLEVANKLLVFSLDVPITSAIFDQIKNGFEKHVTHLKNDADLAYTGPRHHQLAAALKKYVESNEKKEFPRGTLYPAGGKDPVADPKSRLSWAAALLPFLPESVDANGNLLGHPFDHVEVKAEQRWDSPVNIKVAELIVPHYIVRTKGTAGFRASSPLASSDVGASHWVAMAGVGPEAARYPAGDKRAGIFGYDRVTRLDDIPKDRLVKVIALIQVPADTVCPWIAGGGATLRGVSDDPKDNPLQPFLSEFPAKKERGTFAIMADGRVRYISESVKSVVFRSMCQIQAPTDLEGKAADELKRDLANFDTLVPVVKDDELEAAVPVAPAEKPPTEKKPDPPKPDADKKDADKKDDKKDVKPGTGAIGSGGTVDPGKDERPKGPPLPPKGGPKGGPGGN
jgi:hypothetical protein